MTYKDMYLPHECSCGKLHEVRVEIKEAIVTNSFGTDYSEIIIEDEKITISVEEQE